MRSVIPSQRRGKPVSAPTGPQPIRRIDEPIPGPVVNGTHCYRTVSQRSLNVTSRWVSDGQVIPAGENLYEYLFYRNSLGAFGSGDGDPFDGLDFLSADNATDQRAKIYDLVLFGLRSSVRVMITDTAAVSAGAINVSTVQRQLELAAADFIWLQIFMSSDRAEPWVDRTNLSYFSQAPGEYVPVPPLKFTGRDPSLVIGVENSEFGSGSEVNLQFPSRDVFAQAVVVVDAMFLPDPDDCPDAWPGYLCPKEQIGNTRWFEGSIESAKR